MSADPADPETIALFAEQGIVPVPGRPGEWMFKADLEAAERDGALFDLTPEGEPIKRIPARPAYQNLIRASVDLEQPTPCHDDWKFIADPEDLTDSEIAAMRRACHRCEIYAQCAVYARQAEPEAGFWAGQLRGEDGAARMYRMPPPRPPRLERQDASG